MADETKILIEAHNTIYSDRQKIYGDPKEALQNIATQWAVFISQKYGVHVPLTPEDVCWMMADLKKVRQMSTHKRDNIIDAAGYLGLIERVQ